jgi:hypothetical protein
MNVFNYQQQASGKTDPVQSGVLTQHMIGLSDTVQPTDTGQLFGLV